MRLSEYIISYIHRHRNVVSLVKACYGQHEEDNEKEKGKRRRRRRRRRKKKHIARPAIFLVAGSQHRAYCRWHFSLKKL